MVYLGLFKFLKIYEQFIMHLGHKTEEVALGFEFGKFSIRISAGTSAVLTEGIAWFS
jgi:hypothetical protein